MAPAADALIELGNVGLDVDFQTGFLVITWDPLLIMLSFLVSMVGAWRFKEFVHHAKDMDLDDCVFAACIYGACSVWSLHFIAMNSVQLSGGVVLKYNVLLVLASLLATLPGAMSAYYFLVKLRTKQAMHRCVERLAKAFSNHCPSHLNPRRTFCVIMSGLSMVAAIATMHYMGHFSMVGIYQVHNIYALLAIVCSCVGLNISALWLLSQKKTNIKHDIASCIVVALGVAVPHYISALTVRYYADDKNYVAPWTDLEGGPCSNIQKLVLAINFAMGTVIFNIAQTLRERRHVDRVIRSAELSGALKSAQTKTQDEEDRKLAMSIAAVEVDLGVNIHWERVSSSDVCVSKVLDEDMTPQSHIVVEVETTTTCQITDDCSDDEEREDSFPVDDASRGIRATSVPPWSAR
eukprot:TRINITY_DN8606_c0_g2_i1.p1 TRINITY_DN8606_c0_g2~~TRINITY_DN8606_c0_g2_i1.p1  ORF type:complete len:407 (-),score=47.40 TRINITY_DN8606_c0_g2_i1:344-1564(-)